MNEVLARAAGLFVIRAPASRAAPPRPDVVVLGAGVDAVPVAAGIACGAGGGVVAVWPVCDLVPAAALPAARGAARRLEAHGFDGVPRGRVAFTALPGDAGQARAALTRLRSAIDPPIVSAICGPRPAGLDELLAAHDLALVAVPQHADPEIVAAATASLGRHVSDVRPAAPPTGPARLAALAGVMPVAIPRAGAPAAERA